MKRIALRPRSIRTCAEHLTEDSFEQNIAARTFVRTLLQPLSSCAQERHGAYDFLALLWKFVSQLLDKKQRKTSE